MKRFINRLLHLFEIRKIKVKGKTVFLTFDDGPEPDITEFVLKELRKYNAKATFFCRGDNAEKHHDLLDEIKKEGHILGNHTYTHINCFKTHSTQYINDIEKANCIIKSNLFRPPWGAISLFINILLRFKGYKIVLWSLNSQDYKLDNHNFDNDLNNLFINTHPGDIILFHFCKRHENATKSLLPKYLEWLYKNGYRSEILK